MTTAKKIIARFSDIQTLPHVVTRLSKLLADSNSTMRDFEEVIKMDPVLVARLLRLVNSPFTAWPGKSTRSVAQWPSSA